jgi:uncharacterized Fe-S center protein
MTSPVWFADLSASFKRPLKKRFRELLKKGGLDQAVAPRALVAVKLHFGELGNTAFLRPTFVRWVVEAIKERGGRPFLTDANTLYVGSRTEAIGHLETALANGFGYESVGAPLIIADGLNGRSEAAVRVPGRRGKRAFLAAELAAAEAIVSLAHFKGHELTGFGGAIKNLGMGGASRRGKLALHSTLSPRIKAEKCVGCGTCAANCPGRAIEVKAKKAVLTPESCLGCGTCILACPAGAVEVQWNREPAALMEAMAEYTLALVKDKPLFCLNAVTQVSPACDCYAFAGAPLTPDLGFVAGTDPVAVDQAAWDLVTAAPGLRPGVAAGQCKFREVYPKIDPAATLAHGERIKLGRRGYQLGRIK